MVSNPKTINNFQRFNTRLYVVWLCMSNYILNIYVYDGELSYCDLSNELGIE